jgi:hypothetical protein
MNHGNRIRDRVRMATLGLAMGLGLLLNGDVGVHGAVSTGIDPLEVLDLQVRNNVLLIFDTSGSMTWPTDVNNFAMGGDDPMSRMYQAKQAVRAVVEANRASMNFGMATYDVKSQGKPLVGGNSGQLVYVSVDPDAAAFWANNHDCPVGANDQYWCEPGGNFTDVNGTNSADVFRSFQNDGANDGPYPAGCTVSAQDPAPNDQGFATDPNACRYYLYSRRLRSGAQYRWRMNTGSRDNKLLSTTAVTCPKPPVGLTGFNPDDDNDGRGDEDRPCIVMENGTDGTEAYFYLTGAAWENPVGSTSGCKGATDLTAVAPCTGDNSALILEGVEAEIPVVGGIADGLGAVNGGTDLRSLSIDTTPGPNGQVGVRAGQATPLARSLQDILAANPVEYFPVDPTGGLQKNFIILLTDGDDTCPWSAGTPPIGIAGAAENLFKAANPQRRAETFVIAFTTAVTLADANLIARAGSGGTVSGGTVDCSSATGACRDAILATNTDELIDALTSALEIAVASGTFSASPSVVGTIFELGVANGADELDPDTRYNDRSNALFVPLFNLPDWDGELVAYRNDGTLASVTTPLWNAAQALTANVTTPMQATSTAGRPAGEFTFSELHAGADARNIGSSAALIKRRIFTSAGGGRFPRNGSQFDSSSPAGSNVVALWPPDQTLLSPTDNAGSALPPIDPPIGTAGPLDDALGIGAGSVPLLTFAELRVGLGVCRSSADGDPLNGGNPVPAPAACAANDLDTARKEARQVVLAWLAGAELVRGGDGLPRRNGVTGAEFGELLFQAKSELMYDSTLSQPAVMTPPLGATPTEHPREWILYRDGHRNASREGVPGDLDLGFGLRNPDFDDTNPQTKLTLKPRMTVVFYGTNLYLHAINGATGDELWSYVPFDLLDNPLNLIRNGQTRADHYYGIATPLRIADVFIPVPFTEGTFTFAGRWRTVVIFGRGAGGKHLTALDVTAPGPFTRATLQTNPPWVMWSRGNPDQDLAGNAVRLSDQVPYQQMGETWSVPAVGNVDKTLGAPEWRLWVGSGYTDDAGDGRTFYEMDAVTGDVLYSQDVDAVSAASPGDISANALVASPAAWNSFQLDPPGTLTRGSDLVSRVYVPDLHGRVWKYLPGAATMQPFYNAGVDQPFTEAAALGKLNNGDFAYVGSGRDTRVDQPPQFRIYGIEDSEGDSGNTLLNGSLAFTEEYPDLFRNRTQPGVAFNADGNGRVFFVGQRFNAAGASCITSFDTLLFALGAETGAYIYDFDGNATEDPYTIKTGAPPGALSVQGGRVEVPTLGLDPSPTPFTKPSPGVPDQPQIITHAQSVGSPVCRQ